MNIQKNLLADAVQRRAELESEIEYHERKVDYFEDRIENGLIPKENTAFAILLIQKSTEAKREAINALAECDADIRKLTIS